MPWPPPVRVRPGPKWFILGRVSNLRSTSAIAGAISVVPFTQEIARSKSGAIQGHVLAAVDTCVTTTRNDAVAIARSSTASRAISRPQSLPLTIASEPVRSGSCGNLCAFRSLAGSSCAVQGLQTTVRFEDGLWHADCNAPDLTRQTRSGPRRREFRCDHGSKASPGAALPSLSPTMAHFGVLVFSIW